MNELLEKYWSGTTTIEEENALRDYFNADVVAPEHEVYRSMFNSFEEELLHEQVSFNAFKKLPEEFPETDKSTWKSLKGVAIAASAAVLLALGTAYFTTSNDPDLGTYEDPKKQEPLKLKMMKKILIIAAFIVASTLGYAQNYDQLSNLKNTSETVITDEMFKMIANIDMDTDDPEFNELKNTIDNLKEIRIYTTENPESAKTLNSFAGNYIKSNNLVKLMHVKEDGEMFSFHMKKGSNDKKVSNLVMLMNNSNGDSDTVFLVISGDIDLDQISKLTKKMNVPGQDQIEKATSK